ncbi:hypothetical protein FZEAL_976 [Fusarium zealandicum]|uniref:NACHT-NTPase sigma domain-containing protein n=1 Tax=Fusarium zealandicum TaxID=1053134 RepID=A0A8H4UU48_9HYPO|nr:hypothetical protein FZEAL_976 [Fusarium zealandicum]
MKKLSGLLHRNKKRPEGGSDSVESQRHTEPQRLESFPDGVKVWHDCDDATVDICFVHGLAGNRDKTWRAAGQSTPWPAAFIPPKLPRARILTYGYDAYVVKKSVSSSNRLMDHANNMLHDLTTERSSSSAASRAIVFVAHSFGGVVCKTAMIISRNNPEPHLRAVFDCTKGIAFMGTPHGGSWAAEWARIPARALGQVKSTNQALLDVIQTDGQYLEFIRDTFLSMIRELRESRRDLQITCFFEELPVSGVGKIVPKDSACLEGYSAFSIHAKHREMVKFASEEDNGFKRLLGELARWEVMIRDSTAGQAKIRQSASSEMARPKLINQATGESSELMSDGDEEGTRPPPSARHDGPGHQFNAMGGTQNNNTGGGHQFLGNFSGPVTF